METRIKISVCGKEFEFSKQTFEQPHLKDSAITKAYSNNWDQKIPYLVELSPKLFEKYLINYIRSGEIPSLTSFKDLHTVNSLISAGELMGFYGFSSSLKKYIENQVVIPFECEDGYMISFNNENIVITRVESKAKGLFCPDEKCKFEFKRSNITLTNTFKYTSIMTHFKQKHQAIIEQDVSPPSPEYFDSWCRHGELISGVIKYVKEEEKK